MRRFGVVALAVVGLVGVLGWSPQRSAVAAAPASLNSEILILTPSPGDTATITCTDPVTGTASFTTSGNTIGPYPGTFTESGSGAVAAGSTTAFTASFTITSGTTTITGTLTLVSSTPGASCTSPVVVVFGFTTLSYQATIATPAGNYTDQGTVTSPVPPLALTTGLIGLQSFTSTGTPTLIVPTTAAQCRNGGYVNFPQFTSEASCLAFLGISLTAYVPPTTTVATTGCGSVSPNPLPPYFDLFSPGTPVTATPCPGSVFVGWTGGPCDKTTTNPCNIPGGTTGITANFKP